MQIISKKRESPAGIATGSDNRALENNWKRNTVLFPIKAKSDDAVKI